MHPLVAESLRIAKSRIGIREIGRSNTGPEVSAYLRRAGVEPGNPWCCGFVYTNWDDAARTLGVPNPMIRTAYCPDVGDWARHHGILRQTPQAGDLFLVTHGDDFHHIGHVLSVDGNDFVTAEGNSNDEGTNEGYEVASNTRRNADRFRFVHMEAVCPPMPAALPPGPRLVVAKLNPEAGKWIYDNLPGAQYDEPHQRWMVDRVPLAKFLGRAATAMHLPLRDAATSLGYQVFDFHDHKNDPNPHDVVFLKPAL